MANFYSNNYDSVKRSKEIEEGERQAQLSADLANCIYPGPLQVEMEEDEWRYNAIQSTQGVREVIDPLQIEI